MEQDNLEACIQRGYIDNVGEKKGSDILRDEVS